LAATLLLLDITYGKPASRDGLLRMEPGAAVFSNRPYEQLCEKTLFVTPGDVGRYFFVPAFKEPEILASVYKSAGRPGSLPGDYWVTVTRPLRRIAQFSDTRPFPNADTIKVERHDAPIPASTAEAIHQAWLAMLQTARSPSKLDLELDSDETVFYATNDTGTKLRAKRYGKDQKVSSLIEIGELLIDYSDAKAVKQNSLARQIEAKASRLYKQLR
jgi:hypothetical protein